MHVELSPNQREVVDFSMKLRIFVLDHLLRNKKHKQCLFDKF